MMKKRWARLRLWLFYTVMAWRSVYRPKDGQAMIDSAELGAEYKRVKNEEFERNIRSLANRMINKGKA